MGYPPAEQLAQLIIGGFNQTKLKPTMSACEAIVYYDREFCEPLGILNFIFTGNFDFYFDDYKEFQDIFYEFDKGLRGEDGDNNIIKAGKLVGDWAEEQVKVRHTAMYEKIKEFEKEFGISVNVFIDKNTFHRGDTPYLTFTFRSGYCGREIDYALGTEEDAKLHPNSEVFEGYF